MTELKTCPFCGKPVTFLYNSFDDAFKFSHKSGEDEENCCVIGEIWIKGTSLADARKQWNRRADNEKQELKFMNELLLKLDCAYDDVSFLFSALAGISYDIQNLEKNGVTSPEIESIKKILDEVSNHFRRDDNDR